jgi:hypothetical protein
MGDMAQPVQMGDMAQPVQMGDMAQPVQMEDMAQPVQMGDMAQPVQMGDMAQPEQMTELLIVQFPHISCYFLSDPNSPVSILFCSKQKMKKSRNIARTYPSSM